MTFRELGKQLSKLDESQLDQVVVVCDTDENLQEVSALGPQAGISDDAYGDDQLYLYYD
jgi:hypothetical protein